jgi:hypothetical protein
MEICSEHHRCGAFLLDTPLDGSAVPRIDELVKRRAFVTNTRPWLRAAITTTILELISTGVLVTAIVVSQKLGLIGD